MEKLTLTRKEAAELLGVSTATVTQWVLDSRLKAYRISDRPKSPYLFTKEDCWAALITVPAESTKLNGKERTVKAETAFTRQQKDVNAKLRIMLNMCTKE